MSAPSNVRRERCVPNAQTLPFLCEGKTTVCSRLQFQLFFCSGVRSGGKPYRGFPERWDVLSERFTLSLRRYAGYYRVE